MPDWLRWLDQYEKPRSPLSQRLLVVQRLIAKEIERRAPDPLSVLSICAGDGRDVLDVLADRNDASRVKATLIELDPHLCLLARARARRHALAGIEVRRADAGTTDSYVGLDPSDLVVLVGVFGNMSDADMCATIGTLPAFCRHDALVVWGRRNENREIDLARRSFAEEGFVEVATSRFNAFYYIGAHRFAKAPPVLTPGRRFFTFNNEGAGGRPCDPDVA